jgi:hypothetical protein
MSRKPRERRRVLTPCNPNAAEARAWTRPVKPRPPRTGPGWAGPGSARKIEPSVEIPAVKFILDLGLDGNFRWFGQLVRTTGLMAQSVQQSTGVVPGWQVGAFGVKFAEHRGGGRRNWLWWHQAHGAGDERKVEPEVSCGIQK